MSILVISIFYLDGPTKQDVRGVRHEINIKKTKIMRISSGKETTEKISIDGQKLEQVGKFCYLGSMITSDEK